MEERWVLDSLLAFAAYLICCQIIHNCGTENDNSGIGEQEEFKMRYVWAALLDWQVRTSILPDSTFILLQVWLHILIFLSVAVPCKILLVSGYHTLTSRQ